MRRKCLFWPKMNLFSFSTEKYWWKNSSICTQKIREKHVVSSLVVTLSKAAHGQSAIEITTRPAWKTTHLMATNNGYLTVTHEFFIVVHKWARNELFTKCLHEKRVLNFQPIRMSHVCLVAIILFINLPNGIKKNREILEFVSRENMWWAAQRIVIYSDNAICQNLKLFQSLKVRQKISLKRF